MDHGYRLEVRSNGALRFTTSGVGPSFSGFETGADVFPFGEWNYVVATFDAGNASLYVNGAQVGGEGVDSDGLSSSLFLLGRNSDTFDTIDSARFSRATEYALALDGEEISSRSRAGGQIPPPPEPPGPNGVGAILNSQKYTDSTVSTTGAPTFVIGGPINLAVDVYCWAEFFCPKVTGTDLLTLSLWDAETEVWVSGLMTTRADEDAVFARAPIFLTAGLHDLEVRGTLDAAGSVILNGGDGAEGNHPPMVLWVYPIGPDSDFLAD